MMVASVCRHIISVAVTLATIPICVENFVIQTVTKAGTILGNRNYVTELNKNVDTYLGIQYAAAPIGDLRYKAPEPLPNIQTNFLGRETFAPSCPQAILEIFPGSPFLDEWTAPPPIDEDCLYLNIWKPESADTAIKKPVVVWIHGGGFEYGSSSIPLYDGRYLAAKTDAIVVSIQYRLGALGFLYTGDDFAPGNAGLKDQILALSWVHQHIENFGGDKDQITIFGESAGGASVGFHLLNAETCKLFKRALLISGTPNCGWATQRSDKSWQLTLELAKKLGADVSNYEDIKRYLLHGKWQDIADAQGDKKEFNLLFVPTVGPSPVSDHPLRLLEKAHHLKGKEMFLTWSKDEGSILVVLNLKRSNKIRTATDIPEVYFEDFKNGLEHVTGIDEGVKEELVKIYNETVEETYLKGWINMMGDYQLKCPINQFILESRNRGAKVYHAEYNYRLERAAWPDWIGVYHGSELTMLFGLPIHQKRFTHNDRRVNKVFMDRFEDFVHGGKNKPRQLSWTDQIFVISDTPKESDNRTNACANLRKLMPQYLSSGSREYLNGYLGFLVFLHIIIYPGQAQLVG